MWQRALYIIAFMALLACGCKKSSPPNVVHPVPAYQYSLLSKMTLVTPAKTYVDTYTYDTAGTFKNNPVQLRSEIAGKIIKFTYGMDVYFRLDISKITEYDINTNQLIDTYQYNGYQTLEPLIPPDEKDVFEYDANNNLIKHSIFFKEHASSTLQYITLGNDTTHLYYDGNNNMTVCDPGSASSNITYTYDDKHHPLSLLPAENEHLS